MATITIDQAKEISAIKRADGRLLLTGYLGWDPFDEEDEIQTSILLDYLYDSLMFTVEKGFPWTHICHLFDLAKVVQEECIGKTLMETVRIYTAHSDVLVGKVSARNLKIYTEFFFNSFMKHFNLFQYVFSIKQEQCRQEVELVVETPGSPVPFADAKEVAVYEYEKKLLEIEEEEGQRKDERIKEKREVAQNSECIINNSYEGISNIEHPLDREKLLAIIHEVASAHITAASHQIKVNIEETIDDLEFMVEKSALPRPQVLAPGPMAAVLNTPRQEDKTHAQSQAHNKEETAGEQPPMAHFGRQSPPPRYKTKTPIATKRPQSKPSLDSREKPSKSRGSSSKSGRKTKNSAS